MDDPAKNGPGVTPTAATQPLAEADEFAALPRSRTRHPLLALGAGVLALFLIVKMRADLGYFLSSRTPEDLGDARALLASDKGRAVLAEGANRLVRVHGTPDRESALQVDTKGSWTFTQFFKILGTDGRLFVHRREDPLPAYRAEADVFEGRLVRFADLSFQDAIRGYFASHVSATHFFTPSVLGPALGGVASGTVQLRDTTGDTVTLGANDLLAIVVAHPGEIEVTVPVARFSDAATAAAALSQRGATVLATATSTPERHLFRISVPADKRDQVLNAIGDLDWRVGIGSVRETIKVRLADLSLRDGKLVVPTSATRTTPNAAAAVDGTRAEAASTRTLDNVETIRTLAPVQIPEDAYLIVEAETPRDHLPEVAIALVLLVFATVNLVGLAKGLRR